MPTPQNGVKMLVLSGAFFLANTSFGMLRPNMSAPQAIDMTAAQEAEQAGFDLSLVAESLRISHEQRALQHQRALELALELEKIGQQLRDRAQSTFTTPL